MANELVVIEPKNVLTLFTETDQLEEILKQVEMEVATFEHDLSNDARRKKTASLARKVASTKTYLDGLGKELVSDWKAKSKAVDANRKAMRDRLDALRDEARRPLTEWEAEQAKLAEERRLAEEAEKLRQQVEVDHEMGLLMNNEFDRKLEEARKAAEEAERLRLEAEEKARLEREAAIAQEAKERAEREAKEREERIKREAQEAAEKAERERLAAIEREKEAERQRIAAEERAKIQAEQAEKARLAEIERRKQAEIDAEKKRLADIEAAKQAEIRRQKEEAERLERERLQKEANKKHAAKIHNEMMQAAIANGVSEEEAKAFVILLAKGLIPHIGSIQY